MKLKDLGKFDIPESIIEAWRSRQGDYLLPLQEKAIKSGLVSIGGEDQPPNLLISAPTSSGKSFCGEIAAIASLLRRKKAVMLLPLKSIAEEKYNYFRKCYGKAGIKAIVVTGDHPENDNDFELGNFDLALAIYEKFNRLLTVNLDILQQIGLVVVDELQMMSDPHRGFELEIALCKIINSGYNPRIVALSAVVDDEAELADWLGCRIIKETVRPVDLLQGVVTDGYFHFRSFNSGREGREKFALKCNADSLAESLIEFLRDDKSQKLVFLKSRRNTIEAAFRLAAAVNWGETKTTLAQLEGEEPSFLMRSLKQTLSRGVAFHNADLTPKQRQAIELGYRRGEIRVIFSTTTLAMGVNLPAKMVLLETMKYATGNFGGRPSLMPITAAEFQNITGRAGRFGLDSGSNPGRAVVLADSDFEFEVLWSEYIDAKNREKLASALVNCNLTDIILDLIVSGFEGDPEKLRGVLANTLYCRQGQKIERAQLADIVEGLTSSGFIGENLQPTRLGAATAESGISTRSCTHYLKLLDEKYPETLVGWLFLALSGSEFDISRSGLTSLEYRQRVYERLLHQNFDAYISDIDAYADLKIGREPFDFRLAALSKSVFLLTEWAKGVPVERLEQRYQLHHGQIINLAEMAAWLLASVRRLILATGCGSGLPAYLESLSFNVQFGISPEMREIHLVGAGILNRADFKTLENNDVKSVDDLKKIPRSKLMEIITPEGKLEDLFSEIEHLNKEDRMQKCIQNHAGHARLQTPSFDGSVGFSPSLVELDGSYEKERYLVKIDGLPVRLTGKSFKYLAKLTFARLMGGEGWIYRDDIEAGFNQARYLYRLKQEIKNSGFSWSIFENNRLGYYRLDLEPSRIKLNLENLKNHDDYEVRQMAGELALRLAG